MPHCVVSTVTYCILTPFSPTHPTSTCRRCHAHYYLNDEHVATSLKLIRNSKCTQKFCSVSLSTNCAFNDFSTKSASLTKIASHDMLEGSWGYSTSKPWFKQRPHPSTRGEPPLNHCSDRYLHTGTATSKPWLRSPPSPHEKSRL